MNHFSNIIHFINSFPLLCDTFGYIETDIHSLETLDPRISELIGQTPCSSVPVCATERSDIALSPGITYAVIHTEKSGWFFWSTDSMRSEKIYINGKFCGFATDVVSQVWLEQGDNLLVVELVPHRPQPVAIRFSPMEVEKEAYVSVFYTNHTAKGMLLHVLDKGYSPFERGLYEFYLVPATREMIDPSQTVRVEIMEMATRTLLDCFTVPFETWGSVDLSAYEYAHDDFACLAVRFLYQTSIGIEWVIYKYFSFYPMLGKAELYLDALRQLRKSEAIHPLTANAIDYYLQELDGADLSSLSTLLQLISVSKTIRDLLSKSPEEYYRSPGMVYLYIRSKLDGLMIKVPVCVPKQYDPDLPCPLVIHHEILNYGANCASVKASGCLAVNMTGRGITFGGYVGEACFFEILSELMRIYRIDASRIYGIGHCSTAAAVLMLAHNHPDLYAGVLLSECMDTPSDLQNTGDMTIVTLYSDRSLAKGKAKAAAEALSRSPVSRMYVMKECTHDMIQKCCFQEHLIEQLISSTRQRCPEHIHFEIYGNRYTKSAWLTADGLMNPCHAALIEAKHENGSLSVSAENVTGFSVSVPRRTDNAFPVFINGKRILCPPQSEDLHFSDEEGNWALTKPNTQIPEPYIGLGLLDVYLSPLLIWNRAPESEYAVQTAAAFSSPKVLAYNPRIYVAYPIVSEPDEKDLKTHAAVIIDDLSAAPSPLLREIKRQLRLQCRPEGVTLYGKEYHGEYCAMEITVNPWNPQHSILYICCNHPPLLSENLFTRTVRLPSLSSGRHPYLNSRILLCFHRELIAVN